MGTVPAPRTWVDGDFMTTPIANTEIRDPLNFLLSPPRAHLRRVANQSIPTGTANRVNITWDTEDIDSASGFTPSGTNYVVQYAGKYSVRALLDWAPDATGIRALYATINNAVINSANEYCIDIRNNVGTGADTIQSAGFIFPYTFAVGDYITIRAGHNATGALNVTGAVSIQWEGS